MRRTGIDLSSTQCYIVDAESAGRRRSHDRAPLRIHRYATVSCGAQADFLTAELKSLLENERLPRHAWVNLWDAPSSHQYQRLPSTTASELQLMVRRHAASVLATSDAELTIATTIGSTRTETGRPPKTEVSFFAVRTHDIEERLRPVLAAGFVVDGVTTTCGALWSQARLRRSSRPGEIQTLVALGRSRSALGIFGNGLMLYGRDLDWGCASTSEGVPLAFDREGFARTLALELHRSFLYVKQFWDEDVSQVVLCGDMPELRSLTAPLIERLNIEVETLDTLEGIDPDGLPEGFAEQVAAFRLAAAIATEPSPANLLPVAEDQPRTAFLQRLVVPVAASLAALGFLYTLFAWQRVWNSDVARDVAGLVGPDTEPERQVPGVQAQSSASPGTSIAEFPKFSEPLAALPPQRTHATRERVAPQPLPVLRGILVSDGRRFAMIDGRVLGVGDRVASAVVQSIESDAVVLETAAGRTRLQIARPSVRVVRP